MSAPPMSTLLFRSKKPIAGAEWVHGGEEHKNVAVRNETGRAAVSAILARAIVQALSGAVLEAGLWEVGSMPIQTAVYAKVASRSRPGKAADCWVYVGGAADHFYIPHGGPGLITYHLGVLGIARALERPLEANAFLCAYANLLGYLEAYGALSKDIKPEFCEAADELYYWVRYGSEAPAEENDQLVRSRAMPNNDGLPSYPWKQLPHQALTDYDELQRVIEGDTSVRSLTISAPFEEDALGGFIGWQAPALEDAILAGENVLMAGPTGSGKTFALTEVSKAHPHYDLVVVEGKEGLIDLDFLGAIIPVPESDRRVWRDGPILRAMRLAQVAPVILFLDEINRVPREHLNVLLGLMNPKEGDICRTMGIDVEGSGPFYVVEVPMTSEAVWCPAGHLTIVGAGNFGRTYQVYDLDPAVRRRFDTVIEFDFPAATLEAELIQRSSELGKRVADALVAVAAETRRLQANGELPGCVDTASLIGWARKCARSEAVDAITVMAQARLTWADTVCGRDHTGRINEANFLALQDYLVALGKIPQGVRHETV